MKLPDDSIGISDILDYRECPQRFAYDMRRHQPMPERFALEPDEKDVPPENESYASAYGSATHDAIEVVENTACSDEEAIDAIWPKYQHWLEPDDADRIKHDLETWRTRTATGYRLIGTELELRTPLFVHDGQMIYFRGRVDVLYQSIQNPELFLSRDYKTSRWPKSEAEVHKDIQQWSYNFLLHDYYPEIGKLVQQYDQLRFGSIPTQKSEVQRRQIKTWLIRQVKAILNDTRWKPKANDKCQFCPLMKDCRVTHRATDWWKNRLLALAAQEKVGRKIVVQLTEEHMGFETYVDILPRAKEAQKVMERYIAAVEGVLKEMPQGRREELGYGLTKPKQLDKFPPDALRQIAQMQGDDIFQIASITKTAINEFYGEDSDEAKRIIALAVKKESAPSLKASKRG
jgi:hypothetical protein